jgi:DNA-binding transcriptional LysR family regulator
MNAVGTKTRSYALVSAMSSPRPTRSVTRSAKPAAARLARAWAITPGSWSLYASDRYLERRPAPVDPRDLVGHDVIGFHSKLAGVIGAKWIEAHGAGATVAMRLSDMTEVLEAAGAGAGLAILPCVLGDADPRMRRLTREVLGTQPVSLVYKREVGREPPVRAVIRFVTQCSGSNLQSSSGHRMPLN